jgi:hypothetical protein
MVALEERGMVSCSSSNWSFRNHYMQGGNHEQDNLGDEKPRASSRNCASTRARECKRSGSVGCGVIAALSVLVWNPATPPIWVAAVLSVVAFGIGTTYPVGTVSIQNAVSRYQVGTAMGAMNFFRGLTAAFIVAIMDTVGRPPGQPDAIGRWEFGSIDARCSSGAPSSCRRRRRSTTAPRGY